MRMERKYVIRRRIAVVLGIVLFLAIYALIDNAITPDECKVPIEEMSQFCLDLRYP